MWVRKSSAQGMVAHKSGQIGAKICGNGVCRRVADSPAAMNGWWRWVLVHAGIRRRRVEAAAALVCSGGEYSLDGDFLSLWWWLPVRCSLVARLGFAGWPTVSSGGRSSSGRAAMAGEF
ncbi:hypothetical protein Dimus_009617 [Dionaea muscipula]